MAKTYEELMDDLSETNTDISDYDVLFVSKRGITYRIAGPEVDYDNELVILREA